MKKINVLFSLLVTLLIFSSINAIHAQNIFAITGNNQFVSFKPSSPLITSQATSITGVVQGQSIVGIDSRPNTGELYLLGYRSQDSTANLYTLNKVTAVATKIGNSTLKLALGDGTKVGFDFNPTVDRIRIVAGSDKNYRLHPVTGTIASTDGNLSFASTDLNVMKNPNTAASAYTNSYIGAGTTTLFNYDDSLNIITRQDPPNSGTLNTVGNTGIPMTTNATGTGFDIYTNPATLVQTAYFSMSTSGMTNLYTVNLNSGTATLVGQIGSIISITDIAVEIDRTIPARTGTLIYALQGTANLVSFDSENPQTIISLVSITGIAAGQNIVGMDARPKTKELFVLGYNPIDGQSQLYTVIPSTGVATAVGTAPITLMLGAGPVGLDFNPAVDRVRVVGANNNNYRLHPVTGGIAFTDTTLAFGVTDVNNGKNPFVSSVAYTNSFDGSTATQLFGYDDSLNVIVLQSPPNRGTLTTAASTRLKVNTADASTDLDIYYDKTLATNTAFLVTNVENETRDSLYIVNLKSGALVQKGLIGLGISVRDIAAEIDPSIITDINDHAGSADLFRSKLYPNPLTDEASVTFEIKVSAAVEVNVTDILGNVVISSGTLQKPAGIHTYSLHTANLSNGIYIVKIKVDGVNTTTMKAVK